MFCLKSWFLLQLINLTSRSDGSIPIFHYPRLIGIGKCYELNILIPNLRHVVYPLQVEISSLPVTLYHVYCISHHSVWHFCTRSYTFTRRLFSQTSASTVLVLNFHVINNYSIFMYSFFFFISPDGKWRSNRR